MPLLLGWFFFCLILTALLVEGFFGFLLKILVVGIPLFFFYEKRQAKINLEKRLKYQEYVRTEEKKQKNIKKSISRTKRAEKIIKIQNDKKGLPKSDNPIMKSNIKAKYVLKTLRYVLENEPKFPNPNWSKNYKDPEYNKKIELELRKFFAGKCAYCGRDLNLKNKTLDHIMPRQKGGSNRIANLFPCCRDCNSIKGTLYIGDFIIQEFKAKELLAKWWIDVLRNKRGRNLILKLQERK